MTPVDSTLAPPFESTATGPFASAADLRRQHAALMKAVRAAAARRPEPDAIRRFLTRARETGRRIAGLGERDAAQGILDYWASTLVGLPDAGAAADGPWVLDPFDAAAAPDLADKACPFMGLNAFREADADRFFG